MLAHSKEQAGIQLSLMGVCNETERLLSLLWKAVQPCRLCRAALTTLMTNSATEESEIPREEANASVPCNDVVQ